MTGEWPAATAVDALWFPDPTSYPRPPGAERSPYPYQATIPPEIAEADVMLDGSVVGDIEFASAALAHLEASSTRAHLELVASPLLRAESVSSSRIEGLRASHRAVAEAREIPGAGRGVAREIADNVRAMEEAIDLADAGPLTVDVVARIHRTLASGTPALQDHAGHIRTRQNWIGPSPYGPAGAVYVPPPPADLPRLLGDLIKFAARQDVPAIFQAGVVHAQFEAIHPFVDGNGRVGRVLIHSVLRRRGATSGAVPPISVVLAANRGRYEQALASYQQRGDISGWTSFFARATASASLRAERLGGQLLELTEEWREQIGTPRRGSTTERLLPFLVQRPIVTAGTVATELQVTEAAARRSLGELETAGVIRQVTAGRRNRVWAADALFDLLDRFEYEVAAEGDGDHPAPSRHLRNQR